MERKNELEKALQQLKRTTGLDLSINNIESEDQISDAITQIKQISNAYNERYNRDFFLRKWLGGMLSSEEAMDMAKRMHISIKEKRILYLIQTTPEKKEDILTILKNMYPYEANIWILRVEAGKILILQTFYRKIPDMDAMAREIVDTLEAEAMISVKISYSHVIDTLYDLPEAYKEACFTMDVGRMFQCEDNIYGYNTLGMGRLLYLIPDEICKGYLKEKLNHEFGSGKIAAFEMDVLKMVDCFLDNNLNIAETARQLHVHRNTLLYRLDQIEKELGLDIRKFNHAMTYKMASMVFQKLLNEEIS